MSADARDLCTVADVRAALETPSADTLRDSLIQTYITIYSEAIINDTDREFAPVSTAATRRFRLNMGQFVLDLAPYDAASVTSVVLHPESTAPITLTATDQYLFQPISKPDGVFTSLELSRLMTGIYTSATAVRYGFAMVDITGNWGFPSVPVDVKQACILAVTSAMRRDISAFAMNTDDALMLAPDRAATYGLPQATRRLLYPYRRHLVF
jgi:hypothetical protein